MKKCHLICMQGIILKISVYFFGIWIIVVTFVLKKVMAYFHVYTKGLEDRQIFKEKEDYVAGMNLLAVNVNSCDIRMLAFTLMSNHFHFVVEGTEELAERFIRAYKGCISRYLRLKYGDVKFLRRIKTNVSVVDDVEEGLKKLIAYVLNNPVKAGINCVPQGYEWSSARCYFSNRDYLQDTVSLDQYGVTKQRELFHSKKRLPAHWRVTSLGYVLPQSYVDFELVERLFGRSRSFEYFLSRSLAHRTSVNENVIFSDAVVNAALNELLDKKYGALSVNELDDFLKRNIIRDLKGRFSATAKQLARLMEIPLKDVLRYLE